MNEAAGAGLRRAVAHALAGAWPASEAGDAVTLDFDARHRRRIRLTTDTGEALLLDLPRAVAMADGDGLRLEEGGWLAVRAAPEKLLEVRCASLPELVRVAWHLGNRHLPTQLDGDRLLIRPDHVIEQMLAGLGASTREVEQPFQPEGGAYGSHGGKAGHTRHHHGPDQHPPHGDGD